MSCRLLPRIRVPRALVSLALFALLVAPTAAPAASARTGTVTPATPFTWQGPVASGQNQAYDSASGEPCGRTLADFCDASLVLVSPGDFFAANGGGVEFSTSGAVPGSDMDLYVYASDASGSRGPLVGASAGATADERVSIENATGYYLVQVVYFDVTNSGYTGLAEFFRRAKFPPDIDRPAGLPDFLASNPALGYRSHSEPHIAQEPGQPQRPRRGLKAVQPRSRLAGRVRVQDRDVRVVRSRQGRGKTSVPLNVCPQEQAPPSSWPLGNTCYPADDPARGGTGPETRTTRAVTPTSARSTSPPTCGSTSTLAATPMRWSSTRRRSRAGRAGA